MKQLYADFLEVAGMLNRELGVKPLLYGSLGLSVLTERDLSPQDIDMLIPSRYLREEWAELQRALEGMGYLLVDRSEREFQKDLTTVAFASIEDLLPFAGVDHTKLTEQTHHGVQYLLLNLQEYLKVYEQSIQDGYRSKKNSGKDTCKIELIKELLGENV